MSENRSINMTVKIPAALASKLDDAVAVERETALSVHVSRSSITRKALVEHLERTLPGAPVAS